MTSCYTTAVVALAFLLFSFREIDELLRNGANPNIGRPQDHGLTPLHFAARHDIHIYIYDTTPHLDPHTTTTAPIYHTPPQGTE